MTELEKTAAWLKIKTAAIDGLTQRLEFLTSKNPPRIDEIREARELLEMVRGWNVLLDCPGKR